MATINLLPWRAERRRQREREFYMQLGVAAFAAVLMFLAAVWVMNSRLDSQNQRNNYLQAQIKEVDAKIKQIEELDRTRSALLARKEIIEQLQANRSQMVHLFDEMVRTVPDGLRLTGMKQRGNTLGLEGRAEANTRVATYMRNIDVSPWMGSSDLRKIEFKPAGEGLDRKYGYVFSLDVKLRKPDEAAEQEDLLLDDETDTADESADGSDAGLGGQLRAAATELDEARKDGATTDDGTNHVENAPDGEEEQ